MIRGRPSSTPSLVSTVPSAYTHTNLDSKGAAVAKLETRSDNLAAVCTKTQQPASPSVTNGPLSRSC